MITKGLRSLALSAAFAPAQAQRMRHAQVNCSGMGRPEPTIPAPFSRGAIYCRSASQLEPAGPNPDGNLFRDRSRPGGALSETLRDPQYPYLHSCG